MEREKERKGEEERGERREKRKKRRRTSSKSEGGFMSGRGILAAHPTSKLASAYRWTALISRDLVNISLIKHSTLFVLTRVA